MGGALMAWAAGDGTRSSPMDEAEDARCSTVRLHRESVLWFLRKQLEVCSQLQMTMMETRLLREMEKGKSRLYSARSPDGVGLSSSTMLPSPVQNHNTSHPNNKQPPPLSTVTSSVLASQLPPNDPPSSIGDDLNSSSFSSIPPSELLLLEAENSFMQQHFTQTLSQIHSAEQSLLEISSLQTTLANNLALQSAHIDQLVADTQATTQNVGGGNKQLKRATERTRTAKYVFYAAVGLSASLVVWDLLV